MAYTIQLNADEKRELRKRKKNERDGKILRRLICIDMKSKGCLHVDIADVCGVCIDTITDWLRLFDEGRFESLCCLQYDGRRLSMLHSLQEELNEQLEKGTFQRLKDMQKYLQEKHKIKTCTSNLWYFCKKNSLLPVKRLD